MGWRSEIEDKVTITCQRCKKEWLYYEKYPSQKYGLCSHRSVKCTEFNLICKCCREGFTLALQTGTSKSAQAQQLNLNWPVCGPCQKTRNMGVIYIGD